MNLNRANAVIVVWVMDGCPACEGYLPRFKRVAPVITPLAASAIKPRPDEAYLTHAGIPVFIYDAASDDKDVQRYADRYAVRATPTTLILPRGAGRIHEEGAISDGHLAQLMSATVNHQRGR